MEWWRNSANHCAIGRTHSLPSSHIYFITQETWNKDQIQNGSVCCIHCSPLGLDRWLLPQCRSLQSYRKAGSGCYVLSGSRARQWNQRSFHLHARPPTEIPSASLSQFLHFLFHKEWKIPDVHKPLTIFTSLLQVSFESTSPEARVHLLLITLASFVSLGAHFLISVWFFSLKATTIRSEQLNFVFLVLKYQRWKILTCSKINHQLLSLRKLHC